MKISDRFANIQDRTDLTFVKDKHTRFHFIRQVMKSKEKEHADARNARTFGGRVKLRALYTTRLREPHLRSSVRDGAHT
jgi:hypothetical protein